MQLWHKELLLIANRSPKKRFLFAIFFLFLKVYISFSSIFAKDISISFDHPQHTVLIVEQKKVNKVKQLSSYLKQIIFKHFVLLYIFKMK